MLLMYERPRYLPVGDQALAVELGNAISPDINRRVRDLLLAIEKQKITGVFDLMPSYRSLLVYYDPMAVSLSRLKEELESLRESASEEGAVAKPRIVHVPTCYGGEMGPDLDFVAQHNGLTPAEVVSIHSGSDYLVYMLGFSPGFPYLGGMSERIATPRLETPRTAIPTGSVGIAEKQTGIYPTETPGGWRLIGRTPLKLFDPNRDPPALIGPGDYIRFLAIKDKDYQTIGRQVEEGSYQVVTEAGE